MHDVSEIFAINYNTILLYILQNSQRKFIKAVMHTDGCSMQHTTKLHMHMQTANCMQRQAGHASAIFNNGGSLARDVWRHCHINYDNFSAARTDWDTVATAAYQPDKQNQNSKPTKFFRKKLPVLQEVS